MNRLQYGLFSVPSLNSLPVKCRVNSSVKTTFLNLRFIDLCDEVQPHPPFLSYSKELLFISLIRTSFFIVVIIILFYVIVNTSYTL